MKYDNMKSRTLLAALMVGCVLTLGACTSQTVSGKPLTELSFDHVQPLFISASRVDVTNNYAPGADDKDVSSRLPTPPDMAVRRWAEKRLQAANGVGIMHFSIDSATVHQQNFGPETTLERWTGQGAHARYDAVVKISMGKESDARMGNSRHNMTVTRSVTIPDAWPIARREAELQTFVETLVMDVDTAVTGTLHKENLLASPPFVTHGAYSAPQAHSAPPEMRREENQYGEDFQPSYNH